MKIPANVSILWAKFSEVLAVENPGEKKFE